MRAHAEVVRVALAALLVASAGAVVACSGSDGAAADPAALTEPIEFKLEPITVDDPLYAVLDRALQDELRAEATYAAAVEAYGDVRPFARVVDAEGRHVRAVSHLFEKRDGTVPEWNEADYGVPEDFPTGDFAAACALAWQMETDNVDMYTSLIASGLPSDVESVFLTLQAASSTSHLAAFSRCM